MEGRQGRKGGPGSRKLERKGNGYQGQCYNYGRIGHTRAECTFPAAGAWHANYARVDGADGADEGVAEATVSLGGVRPTGYLEEAREPEQDPSTSVRGTGASSTWQWKRNRGKDAGVQTLCQVSQKTLPRNSPDMLHNGAVAKGARAEDGGLDRTVSEGNPWVARGLDRCLREPSRASGGGRAA